MIFDILSNSQILGRLDLISNHDLSLGLRLQKMEPNHKPLEAMRTSPAVMMSYPKTTLGLPLP